MAAVFPDNTVFINFACVDKLPLLESWLRGRGRWTQAVAREAAKSATYWPHLGGLHEAGWMGEPIELDDRHAHEIERIRRAVFGGTRDEPRKHLGEAETCYLLATLQEWRGAWWVSDDRHAVRYAKQRGLITRETIDIFSEIVADGDLTPQGAYDLMHKIKAHDRRGLRLPASPDDFLR